MEPLHKPQFGEAHNHNFPFHCLVLQAEDLQANADNVAAAEAAASGDANEQDLEPEID